MPIYNRIAAANYARTWALSTNPIWGTRTTASGGMDCTNFISQALYAGGWEMVEGPYWERRAWWAKMFNRNLPSFVHFFHRHFQSHTWSGAKPFYDFLHESGRAYWVYTPSQLRIGDLVQLRHDGQADHTMMVTRAVSPFTGNDIYLSYHSLDWRESPYNDVIARAGRDYVPIFWKLRDYYPGYSLEEFGKVTRRKPHW